MLKPSRLNIVEHYQSHSEHVMNRIKAILIATILACIGLLGFALYLQLVLDMLPCPLCVMQRYAFALIALASFAALIMPKLKRAAMSASLLFSLTGGGIAGYQLWSIAQPMGSCGVDPLSDPMNSFFIAKLFPTMFQANGLCETPYDPILGLSIPAWACVWFVVFALTAVYLLVNKPKEHSIFANKL
jgi:disulfide bond formation protein DsbB